MRDNVLRAVICLLLLATATAVAQSWQSGPSTTFRYHRFDGEYFPQTEGVYFLGGRLTSTGTDGSVWVFDPPSGSYDDAGVDMPTPISNYDICLLQDNFNVPGDSYGLYIVAGRIASGANTNVVQAYYPMGNVTDTKTSDPFPGRISGNMYSAQASVSCENKMYVFGGFYATGFAVTNLAYVYDPLASAGSRWTALPNLNHSRGYIMGAVVDTLVFAIGGDTSYGSALYARATCEVLNTRNPTAGWTNIASLPQINGETRAYGFGMESPYEYAGKIIVAGDGQWPDEYPTCFIYDVATNAWSTFPSLIGARRNHAGAFIPGDEGSGGIPGIWVWGGRTLTDTSLVTCEYVQFAATGIGEGGNPRTLARLTVSPQPVTGVSAVRYDLPKSGAVKLTLHDVTGKQVATLANGTQSAGIHATCLSASALTKGIYLLKLEGASLRVTRKVVVR